jgi:hypothetical protein
MGLLLKFAILGFAAYVAWNTVRRWFGQLTGTRPPPPVDRQPGTAASRGAEPQPVRRPVIEDTRACAACGAYVSVSVGKCGRQDCPQP